ncbi:hypothetical protein J6590_032089 [Homalodisca vitripennis]|nr:hypothetical protein J6590_032089 [Homalodisca vitripennis]
MSVAINNSDKYNSDCCCYMCLVINILFVPNRNTPISAQARLLRDELTATEILKYHPQKRMQTEFRRIEFTRRRNIAYTTLVKMAPTARTKYFKNVIMFRRCVIREKTYVSHDIGREAKS